MVTKTDHVLLETRVKTLGSGGVSGPEMVWMLKSSNVLIRRMALFVSKACHSRIPRRVSPSLRASWKAQAANRTSLILNMFIKDSSAIVRFLRCPVTRLASVILAKLR